MRSALCDFVFGPVRLDRAGGPVKVALRDMFEAAQAAGYIPSDRNPLAGDALVIWIESERGQPLAVAVYFDAGHGRVWLDFLYVDVELRCRGLARRLIDHLVKSSREHGSRSLMFGTLVDNKAMQRVARGCGFDMTAMHYSLELGQ